MNECEKQFFGMNKLYTLSELLNITVKLRFKKKKNEGTSAFARYNKVLASIHFF